MSMTRATPQRAGRVATHRFSVPWLVFYLLLGIPALGHAQTTATADRLDAARTVFVAQRAALDADEQRFAAGTTTGDRLRRQTAVAALELADALEAAIAQGTIPAGSTELAWDDALTARQIGGALLLDVGDCEEAQTILQTLVDAPELAARPTVAAAANARLDAATECVAANARVPTGVTSAAAPRSSPRAMSAAPLAIAATAGASAALAAGLWVRTGNAADDARRERQGTRRSLEAYNDARRTAQRARRGAIATSVLAGALTSSAIVVWRTGAGRRPDQPVIGATFTTHTATLRLQW